MHYALSHNWNGRSLTSNLTIFRMLVGLIARKCICSANSDLASMTPCSVVREKSSPKLSIPFTRQATGSSVLFRKNITLVSFLQIEKQSAREDDLPLRKLALLLSIHTKVSVKPNIKTPFAWNERSRPLRQNGKKNLFSTLWRIVHWFPIISCRRQQVYSWHKVQPES